MNNCRLIFVALALFVTISTVGCNNEKLELAESVATEFFEAMKNEDADKAAMFYPGFSNLENTYRTNEFIIKDSKDFSGDSIVVTVLNSGVYSLGERYSNLVNLYLKPTNNTATTYQIYNSVGLSYDTESSESYFAYSTGCMFYNSSYRDQELSKRMLAARKLYDDVSIELERELRENVKITAWSWEKDFLDGATGKGFITNNSKFDFPNLKYYVTLYNRSGDQIFRQDFIAYGLDVGRSSNFYFSIRDISGSDSIALSLDYEISTIRMHVDELTLRGWFSGNECREYIAKEFGY